MAEGGAQGRRPACGFCASAAAVLHCRADDALLCLACDRHVHAANTVASRHPRSLLCDACLRRPAAALCCAHRMLLCAACDFDAHREAAAGRGGHARRPVEPFSGCPGAVELMGLLGVEGDEKRLLDAVVEEGEEEEEWRWEEMLDLDGPVVPVEAGDGLRPADAPPLPKDRNSSCGMHKEEILRQLQGMLKSEFNACDRSLYQEQELGFEQPVAERSVQLENRDVVIKDDQEALEFLDNKDAFLLWQSDHDEPANAFSFSYNQLMQITEEDNQFAEDGADGIGNNISNAGETEKANMIAVSAVSLGSPRVALELSGPDRDSAISRYREKRKTRRYDKRVIYESRRDRANTRIRVKGRFAKINRDSKP